jgi:agmatine deiminase
MTPKESGFIFPAEWATHDATWLSFPWNVDTWEDRFERIYEPYFRFIQEVSEVETVCINAANDVVKSLITNQLKKKGLENHNIRVFDHPTNDSWCRDHGPAFVINTSSREKAIVDWEYNAWGGKYPPFDDDNRIPSRIAKVLNLKTFKPGIVMEGGSIEVNGAGALLTSKSCLLNKNRNPHLNQQEIEEYLRSYYGVDQILWVEDGIVGDDTDGHIDDTTRFVNENTVLTVMEYDRTDANYEPLNANLKLLKAMRLDNGSKLNIVELPMPDPVIDSGFRLPASYANFYISNSKVIVPTYRCKKDDTALEIISRCFPDRKIIGIDSTDIIWGLGSFHCLSQQEPTV